MSATGGVMLCTSNGVGLGHLTRVMAVGDALDAPVTLFTLSAAVSIPVAEGFVVEHLPSSEYLLSGRHGWHRLLAARVRFLLDLYRPEVVLFDGVHPYAGLMEGLVRAKRPVTTVWQRRGMWKPGVGTGVIGARRLFDHVVEPGDFAAAVDAGATAADRDGVHVVNPIVYGGRAGATYPADREAACAELGLDPGAVNVLVQLGAGQINDVGSLTARVAASLRRHQGVTIVLARTTLSRASDAAADVREVSRFPISRWFSAFDGAVLAAGYNSFHEALSARLATIFVPNLDTRTDDQQARARWAHDQGVAWTWDDGSDATLDGLVDALLGQDTRGAAVAAMERLPPADGALEAARLLSQWREVT